MSPQSDRCINEHGEDVIRDGHKFWGRPMRIWEDQQLSKSIEEAEEKGYFHFLQIDFPATDPALVRGSWPFADGMFHLYACPPYGDTDWKYFWEK
jgi:hypothetical protein